MAVAPGSKLAFAPQLVGATVGSQLLVVVPADASGAGGDAATIYVVDVLGIDDPAATN